MTYTYSDKPDKFDKVFSSVVKFKLYYLKTVMIRKIYLYGEGELAPEL